MKQNITVEQLNKLSDKGKERLRKWCLNKNYYEYVDTSMPSDMVKTPSTIIKKPSLLSIGQMIEFLDSEIPNPLGRWSIDYQINTDPNSSAEGEQDYMVSFSEIETSNSESLCDALWETIKEVLKK